MAIDFGSDGSGLGRRWGAIINMIKGVNAMRGDTNLTGATSFEDGYDSIWAQFLTAPEYIEGLASHVDNWQSSLDGAVNDLAQHLKTVTYLQVNSDDPLADNADTTVLAEVYEQMESQSETVDANATSATVATVSATGDTMIVASVKLADGRAAELVIGEVIDVICTDDEQTGATEDQEVYSIAGEASIVGLLAWNWPDGSGATGTITAVDAADTTATTNFLEGTGDFEDQTSNMPDDWTALAGTPGTDILTEASTVYKGSKALEFLGQTVATNPKIAFTLDSDNLDPNMVLHFAGKVRKGASISAGILKASLIDGSNAIIDDDQGTDLATTIAHGSIEEASWTTFSGVFTLPKVLPSTVKFCIEASTAISDTHSLFLDHFSLVNAGDPLYAADGTSTGGVRITAHSGATAAVKGDKYSVTIANDLGGEIQSYLWRIYGPVRQLPSLTDTNETIPDSWIEP